MGKHIFIAHYTAQRIAEQLGNALVYPTMPFAPTNDPVVKDDILEGMTAVVTVRLAEPQIVVVSVGVAGIE